MYLADAQNKENGCPNLMVAKSIAQGVEAEILDAMPWEARDFLVKCHNGMEDKRDLMNQLKVVKKARTMGHGP